MNTNDHGASQPTDTTAIVVVIDRSGSMEPMRETVVAGANRVLEGLAPTDRVTFVQFDDGNPYDVIVDGVPASEVQRLSYVDYEPRGTTPLFDAVGEAITRTARWCDDIEAEQGAQPRVVLTIISDGAENSSTQWTGAQVRELLEGHQARGWTIAYVGLGNDAFTAAAELGVQHEFVTALPFDARGVSQAFLRVVHYATEMRREP